MPLIRTPDDFLYPERIFFQMIKDYEEGHFNHRGSLLKRALVVDVDNEGGRLESNPPNPIGSIRGRVYTRGLDATLPNSALTIFHPFFPEHMTPPVEPDEHVYVLFEDDSYSNGLWVTTVPSHRDVNFGDPEANRTRQNTTANTFEGSSAPPPVVDRDAEFGGFAETDQIRDEVVQTFAAEESGFFEGKTVLHIGDSQVAGAYGRILGDLITQRGAVSYIQEGRVGWGVRAWNNGRLGGTGASRPTVEQLAQQTQPDIILITLGGNDHQLALAQEDYPNEIEFLYRSAKENAQTVIWISPPRAVRRSSQLQNGRDVVSQLIHNTVGPFYVESRDITGEFGRSRDGVHFTVRGAETWATSVMSRLERF